MTATYSFRTQETKGGSGGMVMCGRANDYQIQIQDALNSDIKLLVETPDPSVAPDADLADLARQVNQFFEGKAQALLRRKRADLAAAGHAEAAGRSEVTVFLTGRGLQLGFSYAMEHKEVAPVPRKSLARRLLGPLALGRAKWTMPLNSGTPGVYRKVRWPWVFWVLLLAAVVLLSWFAANGSLADWFGVGAEASGGSGFNLDGTGAGAGGNGTLDA